MNQESVSFSANLQRAFLIVAAFTCSFEIFLVVNLGFNFKFCQLAICAAALLLLYDWARDNVRLRVPAGLMLLSVAFGLSVFFWPNSALTSRSVGYSMWFAFDIVGVLVFMNAFRSTKHLIWLVKYMLLSVIFASCFGLLQFLLGVAGITPPLLTQWWIEGRLPRINGFNYEPSFYATYLTLGWVFAWYLWEKRLPLVSRLLVKFTAFTSTAALILCSSRMGWFAMALWLSRPLILLLISLVKTARISRSQLSLLYLYTGSTVIFIAAVLSVFSFDDLKVLAGGLGVLEGDSAYSAKERGETTELTAKVAADHLLIGGGFGAVPSGIAKLSGGNVQTLEGAKSYEGKNITFELIASLGVAGMFSVYGFFFLLLRKAIVLSRKVLALSNSPEKIFLSVVLRSLTWAILLDLILLQLNQNFLRAYLWTFVGVLAAAIGVTISHLARTEHAAASTAECMAATHVPV